VLIEDPAQKRSSAERLFITIFRFTRAECRVAEALLAGEPPKTIANRFADSENTVRTQIRALYDKTGTRGMAALIALLSRLAQTQAVHRSADASG
jgi:DNA-binding CsgD family transcriptional regulator